MLTNKQIRRDRKTNKSETVQNGSPSDEAPTQFGFERANFRRQRHRRRRAQARSEAPLP